MRWKAMIMLLNIAEPGLLGFDRFASGSRKSAPAAPRWCKKKTLTLHTQPNDAVDLAF
jgi:hypothetical protein